MPHLVHAASLLLRVHRAVKNPMSIVRQNQVQPKTAIIPYMPRHVVRAAEVAGYKLNQKCYVRDKSSGNRLPKLPQT